MLDSRRRSVHRREGCRRLVAPRGMACPTIRGSGWNMTIITKNSNPKNDSKLARHRSTWKGQTNELERVVTDLKSQQRVRYKHYRGRPAELRDMWSADFDAALPTFAAPKFTGTSGVETWLGAHSPFTVDVRLIWADFVNVFKTRSNNGTKRGTDPGTTPELLFICRTGDYFDLIYSKWGVARGQHWFFHWTSWVPPQPGAAPQPLNRAMIDVGGDDEDGESSDTD
jgi:hypothetical protein